MEPLELVTRPLGWGASSLSAIGSRAEQLLGDVRSAARVLPSVEQEIKRIAAAVDRVPELSEDMEKLPATIEDLEARMGELLSAISALLDAVGDLGKTTGELAAATHPMHAATERLEALVHHHEGTAPAEAEAEHGGRHWLRRSGEPA